MKRNDTKECSDMSGDNEPAETPAQNNADRRTTGDGALQRSSRHGGQVWPKASERRSRLQRQQEAPDPNTGALHTFNSDAPERGSLPPAMRKKYLKEFLLNNASNRGFGSVLLSTDTTETSSREEQDFQRTDWVLYPMEHAWMLSAVDGNYETILEFMADDPYLLTRKDFISGFSVVHWLAKRGQSETLVKLLRHAQKVGIPVNVNLKGSGGLTPLHVASMHSQYMVIKLLVGAFGANVDAMDYNGKRAWQYLRGNAPLEMQELLGMWDDDHGTSHQQNANNSACSINQTTPINQGLITEVDSFERKTGTGSWRPKSFKDLLPRFSFFGNKS